MALRGGATRLAADTAPNPSRMTRFSRPVTVLSTGGTIAMAGARARPGARRRRRSSRRSRRSPTSPGLRTRSVARAARRAPQRGRRAGDRARRARGGGGRPRRRHHARHRHARGDRRALRRPARRRRADRPDRRDPALERARRRRARRTCSTPSRRPARRRPPGSARSSCFAGELHAARAVRKVASTSPAAFGSPAGGPARQRRRGPRADRRAPRRPARRCALPDALDARVPIVPTFLGDDGAGLRAALRDGADAIVFVALGAGHVAPRGAGRAARGGGGACPSRSRCGPSAGCCCTRPTASRAPRATCAPAARCAAGSLSPQAARMILLAGLGGGAPRAALARPGARARSTASVRPTRLRAVYARRQIEGPGLRQLRRCRARVKRDRRRAPSPTDGRDSAVAVRIRGGDRHARLGAQAACARRERRGRPARLRRVRGSAERRRADARRHQARGHRGVHERRHPRLRATTTPARSRSTRRSTTSRLTVVIRDSGRGIVPRPDSPGLGLGLPLIATLAESLELGTDDVDHTEVRMTFRLDEESTAA